MMQYKEVYPMIDLNEMIMGENYQLNSRKIKIKTKKFEVEENILDIILNGRSIFRRIRS